MYRVRYREVRRLSYDSWLVERVGGEKVFVAHKSFESIVEDPFLKMNGTM